MPLRPAQRVRVAQQGQKFAAPVFDGSRKQGRHIIINIFNIFILLVFTMSYYNQHHTMNDNDKSYLVIMIDKMVPIRLNAQNFTLWKLFMTRFLDNYQVNHHTAVDLIFGHIEPNILKLLFYHFPELIDEEWKKQTLLEKLERVCSLEQVRSSYQ